MVERTYSKDSKNAYQTLTATIQADKETVFKHLATTEGISSWFPQLSLAKEQDEQLVLFDLGDGTFEKMQLFDYKTNEHIAYEWASGKVEFHLEETNEGTALTLKESLPLEFKGLPEDFTGWFVQMKNIKHVSETGDMDKIDRAEIKQVKEDIIQKLELN